MTVEVEDRRRSRNRQIEDQRPDEDKDRRQRRDMQRLNKINGRLWDRMAVLERAVSDLRDDIEESIVLEYTVAEDNAKSGK